MLFRVHVHFDLFVSAFYLCILYFVWRCYTHTLSLYVLLSLSMCSVYLCIIFSLFPCSSLSFHFSSSLYVPNVINKPNIFAASHTETRTSTSMQLFFFFFFSSFSFSLSFSSLWLYRFFQRTLAVNNLSYIFCNLSREHRRSRSKIRLKFVIGDYYGLLKWSRKHITLSREYNISVVKVFSAARKQIETRRRWSHSLA